MTTTTTERTAAVVAPAERLAVVIVGAGAMGKEWMKMVSHNPHAVVAGVVDLDLDLAASAVRSVGIDGVAVGDSVAEVAARAGAEAVVNVTVPQAHRVVNEQALRAGLPVLCEKPLSSTVSEALRQVAVADLTGGLLMVSQSRRYFNHLAAFREVVAGLGALGTVNAQFFHEDHEPGFREEMAHPLLVDGSIHHFDILRYLTNDEPVSVRCNSWNPPWSWFAGDASATAEFELASGARFVYAGSRCTSGLETSWNADWSAYAERGAAAWNGDDVVRADAGGIGFEVPEGPEGIEGSLAEFVTSLRAGTTPQNEVRANVLSLAMVEAAVRSSDLGGDRVVIADLLEESLARAIADEQREDVAAILRSWNSAADGLATPAWGATPATIASGGAQ